jgi:UPF0176 protein
MNNSSVAAPTRIVVCTLYKFTSLDHFESLRDPVHDRMKRHRILGTLLLASEGINGTICGLQEDIGGFLGWLKTSLGLEKLEIKLSYTDLPPFKRARVKLKKEIVTMGVEGIDPRFSAGTYVEPEQWNQLIDDPEVLLIDTRNEYEIEVGRFDNAVNPHTTSFRDFPDYVRDNLDPATHRKIAMYCTGGIRCEKSTAFLKQRGFEEVYHLKGGILKYLEKVNQQVSKWQGECFVFDERVTVDHSLEKGSYDQCHACRLPITEDDKLSASYQQGVSCPHCFDQKSDQDRARFAERQKQVELARLRGVSHIGPEKNQVP